MILSTFATVLLGMNNMTVDMKPVISVGYRIKLAAIHRRYGGLQCAEMGNCITQKLIERYV